MQRRVTNITSVAMGCALLTLGGWLSVPTVIPFTLQSFVYFLLLLLLGAGRGALTVGVWIAIGACGVPVFSGLRGGVGVLLGPTGGYIFGFLVGALLCWLVGRGRPWRAATAALLLSLSMLAVYAVGVGWYAFRYGSVEAPSQLLALLLTTVVPYLLPDAIKLALAVHLAWRMPSRMTPCLLRRASLTQAPLSRRENR